MVVEAPSSNSALTVNSTATFSAYVDTAGSSGQWFAFGMTATNTNNYNVYVYNSGVYSSILSAVKTTGNADGDPVGKVARVGNEGGATAAKQA
eukprot:366167-Chlamydomonas_euryale.AAC.13